MLQSEYLLSFKIQIKKIVLIIAELQNIAP